MRQTLATELVGGVALAATDLQTELALTGSVSHRVEIAKVDAIEFKQGILEAEHPDQNHTLDQSMQMVRLTDNQQAYI